MIQKSKYLIACSLLALGLGTVPSAQAADAPKLTPEQTYDLYAKTMINGDAESAKKLNDALRPAAGGKDTIDFASANAMIASGKEQMVEGLSAAMPPKSQEALKPLVQEMATLMLETPRRARCAATGSNVLAGKTPGEPKIATVKFHCDVADLNTLIGAQSELGQLAGQFSDEKTSKASLEKIIATLKAVPITKKVDGTVSLISAKGGPWMLADVEGLLAPVQPQP